MKAFRITEVLIYNPLLKSKAKKPIQSDIQEAKIISHYPNNVPIQQKCNTVGMAQGVYQFCKSFHFINDQTQQNQSQQQLESLDMKVSNIGQIITMDSCSLALKEVEQNIWLFLKLQYVELLAQYTRHTHSDLNQYEQEEKYMQQQLSQEKALTILQHFYDSFFIFYGRIHRFLKLDKLEELTNIIEYFIPKYHVINSMQQITIPLKNNYIPTISLTNYLFPNIRAIPLDVNTTLKFQYFRNVLTSYDPMVSQLIIFANGFLTYSSTCKQLTQFFAKYLYGLGEPFKFDFKKFQSRFQSFEVMKEADRKILNIKRYGSVFNSICYGFQEKQQKRPNAGQQDLLGISDQLDNKIFLFEIYLPIPPYTKYYANFYSQKNMTYITLYKERCMQNQIIFQNRFFHDNTDRFLNKISQILTGVLMQNDNYMFIYSNACTGIGKSTLQIKGKDLKGSMGSYLKYAFGVLEGQAQGGTHRLVKHDGMGSVLATTYKDSWIYGIKRMNRMLLIFIPSQVPLHKLGDFVAKMSKQYFSKGYM